MKNEINTYLVLSSHFSYWFLVTQKSISNLFYCNLTLKTLNSKNVKFGEYGKKLGQSNYLSFTYDYQNVEF